MSEFRGAAAVAQPPGPDAGFVTDAAGRSSPRVEPVPAVAVLITLHNEADNVEPLFAEIDRTFAEVAGYEIVAVDDASTDATADQLAAAARQWPHLRVLRHDRRCGQSSALWTAAWAARAPLLVTMDGDLQNDPADALRLLRTYKTCRAKEPRLALVAGQRVGRKAGAVKQLSSRLANAIRAAALGDGTRDTGCGLKAIDRQTFLSLPFFGGMHRFLPALVRAHGHALSHLDVTDRPRTAGRSKYGFWNRAFVGLGDLLAIWWLIRRSRRPGTTADVTPARGDRASQA